MCPLSERENQKVENQKKIDNRKRAGSGGGPDCKLTEVDKAVIDVIGRQFPLVIGLDCSETLHVGIQGLEKWKIPEKIRRPAASSGSIPTCENPGVTRPGIEPCPPWWDASSLTALPPQLNVGLWWVYSSGVEKFGQLLPSRADGSEVKNERAGKTGDPRENPPTRCIVRNDSQLASHQGDPGSIHVGSPDFHTWELCRTMPSVCGFSRGSPVSPSLSFRCRSILTSITLIGSQDLAVKSCPNIFTHP
ncbi:hypothetical protein PR048_006838 [Dryococelus australis]|uniref:Uncharacterized protein n=1 Tax=Dryococelus australis TaxID=614101 RepID=A0ABQ9IC51_9NEOP|nr:hypothetical protein PR048_006838 [Dryococelus australis]